MSNEVLSPFPYLTDRKGAPLDQGYVYIGEEDKDPELFPVPVFWDDALSIPATQPLRTEGGYIVNAGVPAAVHTSSAFSIRVRRRSGGSPGAQVFYRASGLGTFDYDLFKPGGAGLIGFDYTVNYSDNTVGDALRARLYFSAWPGVDPTGAVDNGALLQAFMNLCKALNAIPYLGRGTYLINTTVTCTNWAGAALIGEGLVSSIIKRTVTGTALRFTGCSRATVSDIAFDGTGSPAGTQGFQVDGSGVGVISLLRCQFASFGGRGVYFNGTVTDQMSSCTIADNLFLSCGLIDAVPEAEYRYVNDTKFLGNQYGATAFGPPFASTGAYHYSCQASTWFSNFHWENIVGAGYAFCSYGRWIGERWEENEHEGAIFTNCGNITFEGCHWHTNGQAASNTYDSLRLETCGTVTLNGCQAFNFSGVAVVPKYSITIDAGCTDVGLNGCTLSDYGTAPAHDLTTYGQVVFRGCSSATVGYSDTAFHTWQFQSGSVAGGTTTYISAAGLRGSTEGLGLFLPGFSGRARRLRVYSDVAPGGAETITVTYRNNLADTALTLTMTGATQAAVVDVPVLFGSADLCSLKVVKSAGAATGDVIAAVTVDR